METDCSIVVAILYVKSLLGMKVNEFWIISLRDNVVQVCVFENMLILEGSGIGNSVTDLLSRALNHSKYHVCPYYYNAFIREMEVGCVCSLVIQLDLGSIVQVCSNHVVHECMVFKMETIDGSFLCKLLIRDIEWANLTLGFEQENRCVISPTQKGLQHISEHGDVIKSEVLRRGLEHIPDSLMLWESVVEFDNGEDVKLLFQRAVECCSL